MFPCTQKRLVSVAAANVAIALNPANRPPIEHLSRLVPGFVTTPGRLALLTSKFWGSGGVKLTVGFVEPTSPELQRKILLHMNAWGEFSNVKFTLATTDPQVRISRDSGGYWSFLGTDILHIPRDQQTMNLEGFTLSMPDSEFYRVVRHETGHTLGFPHEHMRRELVARLDPQRTTQYFAQTQGWSAQEVLEQVLTPLEDGSLLRPDLSHADQDSIMCYQLPGSITIDGLPIHGGTDIDDSDKSFAAAMYPLQKPTPPTPPTPPPPPITGGKLLHTFTYDPADMGILLNPASPKSQKVNSAIWLAGFASQMVFPASQSIPAFATPAGTVEDSTVQPHLRAIQSAHELGSDPAQLALPWGTILSWAIQLLAKLALGAAVGA